MPISRVLIPGILIFFSLSSLADMTKVVMVEAGKVSRGLNRSAAAGAYCPPEAMSPTAIRGVSLAMSAREVMANLYQSCEVTKTPLQALDIPSFKFPRDTNSPREMKPRVVSSTALGKYAANNPILKHLPKPPAVNCQDARTRPPVYAYGGAPSVSSQGALVLNGNLAQNPICETSGIACGSAPVSGMDCSAFVSAAYARAGYKIHPDEAKPFTRRDTSSIHVIAGSAAAKTCIARFQPSVSDSLLVGDLVNLAGNHVIMIDSIGANPFGFEDTRKFPNAAACANLGAQHFNFTFIHSGALGELGVARVDAKVFADGSGHKMTLMTNLVQVARQLCVNAKRGQPTARVVPGDSKFSIIRHKSFEPRCMTGKKMPMQGEECIRGCNL